MMAPTTKQKKKYPSYGVLGEPCKAQHRGDVCGGEIRTNYDRKWEQLAGAPKGTPDPERPYRLWVCQRCKAETHEPRTRTLYDPNNPRPDVSEYTQRICKDPYRAS